jgi:hypothetical protein
LIVHVTDLELVKRMWPALEPLFATVTPSTNGCYEVEDVLTDLLDGTQELWVACDDKDPTKIYAAMTTMFAQRPRKKVFQIIFIAGSKLARWKDEFITAFESYAKRSGATLAEGYFRPGWVRVWPGSRISGAIIVKEI